MVSRLLVVAITATSCEAASFAALGRGFFLHDLDLKSVFDWDSSGTTVLSAALKDSSCVVSSDNGWVPGSYEFYTEQSDFASSLGITTDTSVGYDSVVFSAAATVSTAFDTSTSTSTSLSSAALHVTESVAHTSIDTDCLSSKSGFSDDFITQFQQLPSSLQYGSTGWSSVETASSAEAWDDYAQFLQQWGSHVVTAVHSGAMVETLSTSRSESQTDSSSFQLEVCAQVSSFGVSASTCVGYDESDYEQTSSSDFSTTTRFYGGDADLATTATLFPSTEATEAFLQSGDETTAAYYSYTPIWDLLDSVFTSGDDYKRVQIMKAYYTVYLVGFADVPVEDCAIVDAVYWGNDLSSEADFGTDYLACQATCATNPSCEYWSLNGGCQSKFDNDGFRMFTGGICGPASCGTKQESGYEILVTETTKSISFEVVPCNYPAADSSDCTKCGNTWKEWTTTDYGNSYDCNCETCSCDWWGCSDYDCNCDTCYNDGTLEYCSSPEMPTLPDDWVNRVSATTHYSNQDDGGCLGDEYRVTLTGWEGQICAPECELDGSCSNDLPPGVTATAACDFTMNADTDDATPICTLRCNPNSEYNECGTAFCMASKTSAFTYCLYPTTAPSPPFYYV